MQAGSAEVPGTLGWKSNRVEALCLAPLRKSLPHPQGLLIHRPHWRAARAGLGFAVRGLAGPACRGPHFERQPRWLRLLQGQLSLLRRKPRESLEDGLVLDSVPDLAQDWEKLAPLVPQHWCPRPQPKRPDRQDLPLQAPPVVTPGPLDEAAEPGGPQAVREVPPQGLRKPETLELAPIRGQEWIPAHPVDFRFAETPEWRAFEH